MGNLLGKIVIPFYISADNNEEFPIHSNRTARIIALMSMVFGCGNDNVHPTSGILVGPTNLASCWSVCEFVKLIIGPVYRDLA